MAVYVVSISEQGPFKIGHTDNWSQRLRQYWDYIPDNALLVHVLLPEASRAVESELHLYFDQKRAYWTRPRAGFKLPDGRANGHKRDWFDLSCADLLLIESLEETEGWNMVSTIAHWASS